MRKNTIRLFVEGPLKPGLQIDCTRAQANYLVNVMRLQTGAELLVFDGQTGEWLAQTTVQGRGRCLLTVQDHVRGQEEGPDIHYLFAPLKRARLDYMVQKATELGVAALVPVFTQHTSAQRIKLDRMRSNVIEAAEQCGILRIPEVHGPVSLDKLLDDWDATRRIIYCDEKAPLASPLEGLRVLEPGPMAVLVGPEGGFDAHEQERLRDQSYVASVSLGPRVMRADTAAVAALALVNAVLGDWR